MPRYRLEGFGVLHEQPMGRGGLPGSALPVAAWSWCQVLCCGALATGGNGGPGAREGCNGCSDGGSGCSFTCR